MALSTHNACVFYTLISWYCVAGGILRFASYYGDHMVLQRSPERAVLWGYGPDGAQVTISLSGPVTQKHPPVMVTKGIWRLTLSPVEAGGPYNVTAALQDGGPYNVTAALQDGGPYNVTAALQDVTVTLEDVLFGDVWLCGGQSNMAFETSQVFNASEELVLAVNYPHVRLFVAALELSTTELTDLARVELPWSVPTAKIFPGDLFHFSAVCWLFGRYMYDILKYPVGLVESCWGGTPVEAWSSSRALHQCGLEELEDNPKRNNSALWNAMVHPLLNMTLKGAIWYQGEDNTNYHQEKYSCSFPAMIDDWRKGFHEGSGGQTASDLPFGFVQLSTFVKGSTDEGFPNIRWHQTADYGFAPNPRMKKTFMAVAMDLPDETSPFGTIHPRDKQDVAHRLMLGARAVAYGEKGVAFQGPFPELILASEAHLNITFNQNISVSPSKDIFQICCSAVRAPCGPRSVWLPAPIVLWNPTVVQVSTSICRPAEYVAGLQYAWRDWPCDFKACPIYSHSGVLPAPPFRINRWPAEE